jgi:ribulose 1,5-bisphosphate synthetase/thiazole synthase
MSLSAIDAYATVREMTGSRKDTAVIGAGPGGLVTARWLLSQDFEPTIFEQTHTLGGQWTGLAGISGVWPTMHTNTSRILTSFSDLEHDNDLTFPSNQDILAYLRRYADTFALTSRLARRAFKYGGDLRTRRRCQRSVPITLCANHSRARDLHRPGRCDGDLPLPRT